MNTKTYLSYSNNDLLQEAKTLVEKEREFTAKLIECLEEVETRMLFSELGYSSLWTFCTEYLKLSEGSAQRRIAAMRLGRQVLSAKTAIADGTLSLSNATKLESFFKQEKKSGRSKTVQQKEEILHSMKGLSQSNCEKKLFTISPAFELSQKEILKPVSSNQNILKVVLRSDVVAQLNSLKDQLAHTLPNASYADLIGFLALDKLTQLKKKNSPKETSIKIKNLSAAHASASVNTSNASSAADSEMGSETNGNRTRSTTDSFSDSESTLSLLDFNNIRTSTNTTASGEMIATAAEIATVTNPTELSFSKRKKILVKSRKALWQRSGGRCEYIAPDGKRCESSYALEADHIQSVASGGGNEFSNLRLVCRSHNQFYALQEFGYLSMGPYLPKVQRASSYISSGIRYLDNIPEPIRKAALAISNKDKQSWGSAPALVATAVAHFFVYHFYLKPIRQEVAQ